MDACLNHSIGNNKNLSLLRPSPSRIKKKLSLIFRLWKSYNPPFHGEKMRASCYLIPPFQQKLLLPVPTIRGRTDLELKLWKYLKITKTCCCLLHITATRTKVLKYYHFSPKTRSMLFGHFPFSAILAEVACSSVELTKRYIFRPSAFVFSLKSILSKAIDFDQPLPRFLTPWLI